jgi:hypothetical protein
MGYALYAETDMLGVNSSCTIVTEELRIALLICMQATFIRYDSRVVSVCITAFRSIGCQNSASTDKQIRGLFESMFALAWRMNIIRRMRRAICLSVSDPVHRRIISAHPMVLSLSQAYDFRMHRGRGVRQASDAS